MAMTVVHSPLFLVRHIRKSKCENYVYKPFDTLQAQMKACTL